MGFEVRSLKEPNNMKVKQELAALEIKASEAEIDDTKILVVIYYIGYSYCDGSYS